MKKQKKLNLGKINIAGINNIHSIIGGVQTNEANTCASVYSDYCPTNDCPTNACNTDAADSSCATTQHTKAESNYCGDPEPSQNGEIC